ncbi:MAG: GGDEF domain-containing protein [Anaerolineaceae bacterium]|nr:GGDEF domain-containing protein [Anaerolineaceae bacterium]
MSVHTDQKTLQPVRSNEDDWGAAERIINHPDLLQMLLTQPARLIEMIEQPLEKLFARPMNLAQQKIYGKLLYTKARAYKLLAQFSRSLQALSEAYQIFEALDDIANSANCLAYMGGVYDNMGNHQTAYQYILFAYRMIEDLPNEGLKNQLLNDLGYCLVMLDRVEEAMAYLNLCIDYCNRSGDQMLKVYALDSIAYAYLRNSEPRKAIESGQEALELARALKNAYGEAIVLNSLAEFFLADAQYDQVSDCLNRSVKISEENGYRFDVSDSYKIMGKMSLILGDLSAGRAYLDRAISIAKEIKATQQLINIYNILYQNYRERGLYKEALEFHEQYHEAEAEISQEVNLLERQFEFVINQAKCAIREAAELRSMNQHLKTEINERERLQHELEKLAFTDPLTGLVNRRAFFQQASNEFERSRRYHHPISLIMIDIDHFKLINDRYGHQCGDKVLSILGKRLIQNIRLSDVICRFGGEEFVILLPETKLENALKACKNIQKQILQPMIIEDESFAITTSIGVAHFTFDSLENAHIDQLIECADRAMYFAKNNGRNSIAYFQHTHCQMYSN